MRYFTAGVMVLVLGTAAAISNADEVVYSLDNLVHHPYSFVPAYGHASQSPGSAKYFVPGYGYRIPGYGIYGKTLSATGSYLNYFEFGQRVPGLYDDTRQRFRADSYGGPWYHAGWTANTRSIWPAE